MGKLLLATAALLLTLAACVTTGGTREMEARVAQAATPQEKGRIYYETGCQRCHALYMPKSFSAGEWKFFVHKYGRKARLSKEKRDLVYAYLAPRARGE